MIPVDSTKMNTDIKEQKGKKVIKKLREIGNEGCEDELVLEPVQCNHSNKIICILVIPDLGERTWCFFCSFYYLQREIITHFLSRR